VPVIVDFWAPWCGPCKQLSPALERAVGAARGAVRLIKVNIDENPELAQELRIQSIPAVFAFYQGRPVDGFMGALPESQVTAFIERLVRLAGGVPAVDVAAEVLKKADTALAEGDVAAASALYGQVLSAEAANPAALAGIARCRIAAGDAARARELLDGVPADLADAPEIAGARSALELAEQSRDTGVTGELRARLEKDSPWRFTPRASPRPRSTSSSNSCAATRSGTTRRRASSCSSSSRRWERPTP
jgi:putative thioredoxin